MWLPMKVDIYEYELDNQPSIMKGWLSNTNSNSCPHVRNELNFISANHSGD